MVDIYERDKGTREIEGWRGRSKTLRRAWKEKNQTVKETKGNDNREIGKWYKKG